MRIACTIFALLLCCSLPADVVLLKDGTRVEGDVKRGDDGYDVTGADGKIKHIASSNIASIQLGKNSSSPIAGASDRLASLKRSVEQLDDLPQIIERFTRFIQTNPNAPATKDAEQELAVWQERLDRGMVKVAGQWVLPQERQQMVGQASSLAQDAYRLMKQNQLKEAEPIINHVLELDPRNAIALYLQGVLLYRQEKLPQSRRAFESLRALLPSHAATLNNIAVIAWRQNQYINSLTAYDDAMLAMPANKEILGNVAEALTALRPEFVRQPVVVRVQRRFTEQQTQLEALMARYGWYRWGSTWLNQQQLDQVRQSENDLKEKVDALQKQFDELKDKIAANQSQIDSEQRTMDDISSMSYIMDSRGRPVRTLLPQSYYNSQRNIDRLKADNVTINDQLNTMRETARRLTASGPKPKFTGIQQLIGVEGTPGLSAATQPATQPSTAPAL